MASSFTARRGALLLAGALCVASCAAPQPMTVGPAFADRPQAGVRTAAAAAACKVVVSQITDRRRARDTLGMVAGRAVKSPGDADAWLRSVLAGLGTRGVGVSFGDDAAATIAAQFELQTVWLNDIKTSKTATVVVHIRAQRAGLPVVDRDYRGAVTRINWASTDAELQRLIDDAFGKALDQMAVDFRAACAS